MMDANRGFVYGAGITTSLMLLLMGIFWLLNAIPFFKDKPWLEKLGYFAHGVPYWLLMWLGIALIMGPVTLEGFCIWAGSIVVVYCAFFLDAH